MGIVDIPRGYLKIDSIRSFPDFNSYYHQNFQRMIKLYGKASGAEGHYIRAPFLSFGFRRFDEEWRGDMPSVFVVDIPKQIFLDLGYSNEDYEDEITGFLEGDIKPEGLYIARMSYRTLSRREEREIDGEVNVIEVDN